MKFLSSTIHPVVLLSALDHYMRRNENQEFVIGCLLGMNSEGIIEIKNSFPVPHTQNPTSKKHEVNLDFLSSMLTLHQKAYPKEIVVGWYSTGTSLNEDSVIIHELFSRDMQSPTVHLTIDTTLIGSGLGIKAYTLNSLQLPGSEKPLASQFQPLKLEIESADAEKSAIEFLLRSKTPGESRSALTSEIENVEVVISQVQNQLESILEYTQKILNGETVTNPSIGRFLSNTIFSLPKIDQAVYEKTFNDSLQDLLMVMYLSNLVKTQLSITEKLQLQS